MRARHVRRRLKPRFRSGASTRPSSLSTLKHDSSIPFRFDSLRVSHKTNGCGPAQAAVTRLRPAMTGAPRGVPAAGRLTPRPIQPGIASVRREMVPQRFRPPQGALTGSRGSRDFCRTAATPSGALRYWAALVMPVPVMLQSSSITSSGPKAAMRLRLHTSAHARCTRRSAHLGEEIRVAQLCSVRRKDAELQKPIQLRCHRIMVGH